MGGLDGLSTRLMVKNIPKHVDEKRLKEHFGEKGHVSDARIIRTKEGQSRLFGFIGYSSAEDAKRALKYFNGTFLDTSKLVVEVAKPRGDQEIARPWSKHSAGSSRHDKVAEVVAAEVGSAKGKKGKKGKAGGGNEVGTKGAAAAAGGGGKARQAAAGGGGAGGGGGDAEGEKDGKKKKKKKGGKEEEDKGTINTNGKVGKGAAVNEKDLEKEEFFAVMKSRSKAKFWANDDTIGEGVQVEGGRGDDGDAGGSGGRQSASASRRRRKGGDATSEDEMEQEGSGDDDDEIAGEEEEDEDDDEEDQEDDEKKHGKARKKKEKKSGGGKSTQAALSDMDWLKSRASKTVEAKEHDDDHDEEEEEEEDDDDDKDGEDDSEDDDEEAEDDSEDGETGKRKGKGKPKKDKRGTAEAEKQEEEDDDEEEEDRGNEQEKEQEEEETGRIFVRNLPYTCTEEELQEVFGEFGTISEVHIPVTENKTNKGFAFVQFILPEAARNAMKQLDGQAFQGRLLHLIPARPQPGTQATVIEVNGGGGGGTYKAKKEKERREKAKDATGWNASFMRGDAIVDALAARMGIAKGEILDREEGGGEMAVKMALAETALIRENKQYFEEEGVDLSVLETGRTAAEAGNEGGASSKGKGGSLVERSDTVILVKNLPYSSDVVELTKLFGAHGDLARVLLPPSKSVALVEFLSSGEARAAFKRLAYKRYQHVPLYLEWAPVRVFGADYKPATGPAKLMLAAGTGAGAVGGGRQGLGLGKVAETGAAAAAGGGGDVDVDGGDGTGMVVGEDDEEGSGALHHEEPCTVYVKNLSFNTSEEQLRKMFSGTSFGGGGGGGGVRTVTIPQKKVAKKGGSKDETVSLSMGYGFVEFSSEAHAKKAIATYSGVVLDGHALELKQSTKRLSQQQSAADTRTSTGAGGGGGKTQETSDKRKGLTKLIARNVPFQASAKELRELFKSFGQLKRVRLPKKFDGSHRGFAFIDFVTPQEAKNAFDALSSTHFYGRHLVLEWAAEEEGEGGGGSGGGDNSGGGDMEDASERVIAGLRQKAARDLAKATGGGGPNKRQRKG